MYKIYYKRYIQVNSKQFTIGIQNRSQSGISQVNKEYHRMETKPNKTLSQNYNHTHNIKQQHTISLVRH